MLKTKEIVTTIDHRLRRLIVDENTKKCIECGLPAVGKVWEIEDPEYLHESCEIAFTRRIKGILGPIVEKRLSLNSKEVKEIAEFLMQKYWNALRVFRFLFEKYESQFYQDLKKQLGLS